MRAIVKACLTAAALIFASSAAAQETSLLHPMFADHAVLQRDQPIRIYGTAQPNQSVTISLGRTNARARADASGAWTATLRAQSAGGPHTLTARAGAVTETINDVMVGDVFLCSGQSNMAWPVAATLGANFVIQGSAKPNLRMMTIAQETNVSPLATFRQPVAWEVAGPETVGRWSAACYYMARELQRTADVPIGLINASWGGANIRPWISEAGFRRLGGYDDQIAMLNAYTANPRAAQDAFGAEWERWWRAQSNDAPGAEPWNVADVSDWRVAPQALGNWQDWSPELATFTGTIWFRTVVTLTAAQAAQGATLHLGGIDEVDQTWINGRVIGNTFGWGSPRIYEIPAGVLRAGENVIVTNVLNTWGAGGLTGDVAREIRFANGESAPLTGEWRYRVTPSSIPHPPRSPWEAIGGLTTMYNGMIAPIGQYNLRGVAWYQGESNTSEAETYAGLLGAYMNDWRDRFRNPQLPFLIVQLPNFGDFAWTPVESGWASLRDQQRRAVAADPHSALVVTIDAGDPADLHPQDKAVIGRRLAQAARAVVYGEDVAPSGPEVAAARRQGGDIVIDFSHVDRSLVSYSGLGPNGFELCGADQASCRFVRALASGTRVTISGAEAAQATRVRYCWADSPVCTLYDEGGAPAGPFEITIQ